MFIMFLCWLIFKMSFKLSLSEVISSYSRFKFFNFKVSATPSSSLPKRTREEEEDNTIEASDQVSDDTVEMPLPKRLKTVTPVGTEVSRILSILFILLPVTLGYPFLLVTTKDNFIMYYLGNYGF